MRQQRGEPAWEAAGKLRKIAWRKVALFWALFQQCAAFSPRYTRKWTAVLPSGEATALRPEGVSGVIDDAKSLPGLSAVLPRAFGDGKAGERLGGVLIVESGNSHQMGSRKKYCKA